MKHSSKSSKYEPTIADVLDAVQTGFTRHEKVLTALHEGQGNLKDQLKDVDRRLSNTQNRVEDIADIFKNVTRTTDKDRISILDHERRIQHLEKTRT